MFTSSPGRPRRAVPWRPTFAWLARSDLAGQRVQVRHQGRPATSKLLCERSAAVPLELEYECGRSGSDLLAAFENLWTLPWIWRDGEVTGLGFSLAAEAGVACVGEDFDDGVDLIVPALAEVSTDDGRFSGSIPVTQATPGGDATRRVAFDP